MVEVVGVKFVYVSMDYVFDGIIDEFYNEFFFIFFLGVYGKFKLVGE